MTREEIRSCGLVDKETYSFDDFRKIVEVLRDPDGGCPWDKAQTHDTLRDDFQNEVNEVFEGIDRLNATGDGENLCEELGDVLLHILMQARIAEQEGLFSIDDVIQAEAEKMVRRHPHIFADGKADSAEEVLLTWEEVKRREREEKARKKAEKAKNMG